MKSGRLSCLLFVAIISVAGIGVGFSYSVSIEVHNTIQSDWCVLNSNEPIIISNSEDGSVFTTSVTYTESGDRPGFMTITFNIRASGEADLGGSTLSITSPDLGVGIVCSCILKADESMYKGTVSGLYVTSKTTFILTGQLENGSIESVSMDITVYPEVVA